MGQPLPALGVPAPGPSLPDLHCLASERLQLFWAMAVLAAGGLLTPKPAEVSDLLRDAHGVHISRQRSLAILGRETATVARSRKHGPRRYKLMKAGYDELHSVVSSAFVVSPANALTGIRQLDGVLNSLRGRIRVCDPYIGSRTLVSLAELNGAEEVRLLTESVDHPTKFSRDLAAYRREFRVPLEVRRTLVKQLHDRYVVHDGGMVAVGCSLKDLGRKQAIVMPSVSVADDLASMFDQVWDSSESVS